MNILNSKLPVLKAIALLICFTTLNSFAGPASDFVFVERQGAIFALPQDWEDRSNTWVEPTAKNKNSQAADFTEPDESKPFDFRGRIHLSLQLTSSTPDEELTLIKDGVIANMKMMKPETMHLDESPKIINFAGFKALVWKWTLTQEFNVAGVKNRVSTRMIYIAGQKYIYKFNLTGEEERWGKIFNEIVKTIKVDQN